MASRQHIPSPDEIAQLIAARERGEEASLDLGIKEPVRMDEAIAQSPTSVRSVSRKIDKLTGQVQSLIKQNHLAKSPEEIRKAFDLALQQFNLEPVIELARMVCETRVTEDGRTVFVLDPGMRKSILTDLAKFRLPTLKAMEVSGSVSHEHKITIVRFGDDGQIRQEKLVSEHSAPIIDVEATA